MQLAVLLLALSPFDRCEQQFREAIDPSEAYMCFYFTAQETKLWMEGEERVIALIERLPEKRGWLDLVLGHIQTRRDENAAEASYRTAALELASDGEAAGEILARNNLTRILQRQGRIDEAGAEVEKVLRVAERSEEPSLIARARISEADYLSSIGRDLARAYRSLKRAEQFAFPDGSRGLKRRCLAALGDVAYTIGRLEESVVAYERLLILLREDGDTSAEAMITFNLANTRMRMIERAPDPRALADVLRLAHRALELSERSEYRQAELLTHRLLADLLPRAQDNEARIRHHLAACVALADEVGYPERKLECLWTKAEVLATSDPDEVKRAMEQAIDVADELDSKVFLSYAWRSRARVSWKTRGYEDAVADSFAALDVIESLRRLQDEEGGRAQLFSDWTRDYYTFSGRLLEAGELDRAFSIIERMRSRVLLDSLEASRSLPDRPENDERVRLLHEMARVQRQLLDPRLTAAERDGSLQQLERLEHEEAELREPYADELREPRFANLAEVQAALGSDEVVLSFQVGLEKDIHGDFDGGAWLLSITRDDAKAFRIPDRLALEPAVRVFVGLLARGDGVEARPAARLYGDLLERALDGLSPEIHELIVIPDGALHHLPFAALRAGGEPLAKRYNLTIVPSGTLWLRWRKRPSTSSPILVLALADPALGVDVASKERNLVLREGVTLGRLPHARREGRTVVRHLGGDGVLLVAEAASERAIKDADLSRYRILHFAAHAVADEENPERSAVVLSPGDEIEDGLLQAREIGDLQLDGRVIVLSACRTASGRTLSGEGVLSLARAFFQAGAHAVVASRWPLRDDEAAFLFDRFYRALGGGVSVAAALRSAQEDAITDGLPASAWSSLVVYGNGALTPVSPQTSPPWWTALVAIVAVAMLAALVDRLRRARKH